MQEIAEAHQAMLDQRKIMNLCDDTIVGFVAES